MVVAPVTEKISSFDKCHQLLIYCKTIQADTYRRFDIRSASAAQPDHEVKFIPLAKQVLLLQDLMYKSQ